MNRRRFLPLSLKEFAPLLCLAMLMAMPAHADVTIGGACTGAVSVAAQAANGNNAVCISSLWQYPVGLVATMLFSVVFLEIISSQNGRYSVYRKSRAGRYATIEKDARARSGCVSEDVELGVHYETWPVSRKVMRQKMHRLIGRLINEGG